MNLKNIMLTDRSQAQKDNILHDSIYIKFLEKAKYRDRISGCLGQGVGAEIDCKQVRGSDANVLKLVTN